MKKNKIHRSASIEFKDENDLIMEGLLNPYYYNFGRVNKYDLDGTKMHNNVNSL